MTPQLMQAIKLLQLSNLDLAAYVEGELEKNPLLERAAEGEPGVIDGAAEPVAAESTATAMRAGRRRRRPHRREPGDQPQRDRGAARHRSRKRIPRRRRPSRAARRRGRARAPFGMGQRRQRRPRGRRLQSGSLRVGRADARRSSRRAAGAGDRRSGAAHDRAIPDRHGRRGRLPHRRSRVGRREARRAARPRSRRCSAIVQSFDPPGVCARNLTECLAIQLKERDRFDPAMAALVGRLDLLAKRDLAGAAPHLRRRRRGSRRHDRRNPQPQSEARPRLRLRRWCSRSCPTSIVRPGPDGGFIVELNSDTLPKVLVNQRYHAELSEERQGRQRQDLSGRESAVRDLADARARSARQDHPQGRDRDRQPAGRASSRTACSICARSISRPSPTPSACTNRRCRASPPTNTWRPTAASSS